MLAFRTIFSILLQPKKKDQITILSTIQLMKRCLGQSFETFFGYLSQREKLSEIKLPLEEGFYVSTYLTFLVLFFFQITATGVFCFSHLLKGVSELTTWILFILTILQEVVKTFKFVLPPKKSLAIRAAHVKSHFGHWRRGKSFEWENSNVLSTS